MKQTGGSAAAWPDAWLVRTLQQAGVLTELDLPRLQEVGARSAWAACVLAGVASDEWILAVLSQRFRLPIADVDGIGPLTAALLPGDLARRQGVVPLGISGPVLEVACSDPTDMELERMVAFGAGRRVRLHLASPASIQLALDRLYPGALKVDWDAPDLARLGECAPGEGVVRELEEVVAAAESELSVPELVDALIVRGIRLGASDLHLEPTPQALVARYRVDGLLHEITRMPRPLMAPLTSRLKVMANLDIADRLRPQDGRAQAVVDGRRVDLRISSLPIAGLGEKIVVRILDSGAATANLDRLGFEPAELVTLKDMLNGREGLVLVTGPTGSGKTTTLYAALRAVQTAEVNIVTIEDPIEYRLEGISQVQVNEKAGLTFATTLRSILRQDPDVVLLGEIRDHETAEVALQASLTGHLVISTLHTNDAPGSIMRLLDMGVDRSSLATALRGVVSQRLIRRICTSCGRVMPASQLPLTQQALLSGVRITQVSAAVGCTECHGTGYRGRLAVAELAVIDANVQRTIARSGRIDEIADACRRAGMRSLWDSGLQRVARGLTTLHELLDNVAAPAVPAAATAGGSAAGAAMRQEDIDALVKNLLGEPANASLPLEKAPAPAPAPVRPVLTNASPTPRPAEAGSRAPERNAPPAATPACDTRALPYAGGSAGAWRVLLVDEDPAQRKELREGLQAEGFRVLEASDGQTALEYIRRVRPAVVVLELALPRVDGFGILAAVADGTTVAAPRPLCVVLTSQDDADVAAWVTEAGAADYLVKPVTASLLASRLRARLGSAAA